MIVLQGKYLRGWITISGLCVSTLCDLQEPEEGENTVNQVEWNTM